MAVSVVPLSKVHPRYLHSNATSHVWAFGAIAELIDNAYDPDVAASELWIDWAMINGKQCLTFEDNGHGMNHQRLLHMLSFGYCEKAVNDKLRQYRPIGQYGNGFKSGSMRLAKDALVFTVCRTSASVGFLSATYLSAIESDCVRVPMVEYALPDLNIESEESKTMLDTILEYSPFATKGAIRNELEQLRRHSTHTGTKIILFNLQRLKTGCLELDFESDLTDIRNPEVHEKDVSTGARPSTQVETSEYKTSLRCYCGILFLVPRMKIFIRKKKVKNMPIAQSLIRAEENRYKPSWLAKPLPITFGFVPKRSSNNIDDYGVMFYHKNRLIKAYEKLGYQKRPDDLGVGVVGVVHNADFLTPTHIKQDFVKDEKYNSLLASVSQKLNDYWNAKKSKQANQPENQTSDESAPVWKQCDSCLKWRRIPSGTSAFQLPEEWFCRMNLDPTHNRCDAEEEERLEGDTIRPRATIYKKQPQMTPKKTSRQDSVEEKLTEAQKIAKMIAERKKKLQQSKQFKESAGKQPKNEKSEDQQIVKKQHQKQNTGQDTGIPSTQAAEQKPKQKISPTGDESPTLQQKSPSSSRKRKSDEEPEGSKKKPVGSKMKPVGSKKKPVGSKMKAVGSKMKAVGSKMKAENRQKKPAAGQYFAQWGIAAAMATSFGGVNSAARFPPPSTFNPQGNTSTQSASSDDLDLGGEGSPGGAAASPASEQIGEAYTELLKKHSDLKHNVHSLLSRVIDDYEYEEDEVERAVKELTEDNFAKLEALGMTESLRSASSDDTSEDPGRCLIS